MKNRKCITVCFQLKITQPVLFFFQKEMICLHLHAEQIHTATFICVCSMKRVRPGSAIFDSNKNNNQTWIIIIRRLSCDNNSRHLNFTLSTKTAAALRARQPVYTKNVATRDKVSTRLLLQNQRLLHENRVEFMQRTISDMTKYIRNSKVMQQQELSSWASCKQAAHVFCDIKLLFLWMSLVKRDGFTSLTQVLKMISIQQPIKTDSFLTPDTVNNWKQSVK